MAAAARLRVTPSRITTANKCCNSDDTQLAEKPIRRAEERVGRPGCSKNCVPRLVAAVCDSMNCSRAPRAYDDVAVKEEFDRLQASNLRRLLKVLPALPSQIRRHAVLSLGRLRCRTAGPALFQLILNKDEVASLAAVALSDIVATRAATRLVQRALRALKAGPEFVRYSLVEFLMFCDELTPEQHASFLNSCLMIALDQREGASLRSRSLEALAVRSYKLDKRTRLARQIPQALKVLARDSSMDVQASATYAVRVLKKTGF